MLRGFLFDLWRLACLYGQGLKSETCGGVQCPGAVCMTQRYALLWPWGGTGRVEDVARLWEALGAGPVLPVVEDLEPLSSA